MSEFLKMDVFFVVATIGFAILIVMLCVALWYMIQILRATSRVVDSVEEETQALKQDFDEARTSIRRQGTGLLSGLSVLSRFAGKKGKRPLKKQRTLNNILR